MARARNIKPAFFQDDKLGEIIPLARLAFIGMWTIADYKGCFEYRPKMLKVQLLPYDDADIEEICKSLEQYRFIRFYSANDKIYVKIINFEKHQNPHKNEKEAGSDIPDFREKNNSIKEMDKDGTDSEIIGSTPADSLNTDSLNTDSIRDRRIEYSEEFEEVWHAYPKRSGANKKETYKAWNARLKSGATIDEMVDGVRRYAAYCEANNTEEKYIKQPSTFFGPSEHFLSEWRVMRSPMSKQDSLKRTGDLLTGRAREDATITIDVD